MFPEHLTSLRGDMGWSVQSLNLSPCDYLKEKVFKHHPESLEDLKEWIQQKIDTILTELTQRVMKNFRKYLQQCVNDNSHHLSDTIFKIH